MTISTSRYKQYQVSKGIVESESEFNKYFVGSLEGLTPDFDILMWWNVNSSKFPIIAYIARDVLVIPISAITSESAFALGKKAMAELLLSAFLEVLFDRVASPELLKFAHREGLRKQLDKWRETMERIREVLDDAEEKQ
ncbi:zinc finger BED domain-containing protein DAYSLEEPER-like [Juglans regia]|uniref:Zinc finger BED domain-containing protein DAYSLEEPER-like n=1 Tax=Juglans regia TaxID=51240 RepID=A0A6P9EBG0_JUGRE|nr:zinc finger BED domain-containing protein DAYSLEEPER-like [Juglans regia]